jgi:ubiquinone/menaquinone biosynthesis C-methylase UbiE
MGHPASIAFDRLANTYDSQWTNTLVGRKQREATWRWIDPLFLPGETILDLGCGTGADAVHLMSNGIGVLALDASAEMVKVTRTKGVDARCLSLQHLAELDGSFDGAISNFGALNCVDDLHQLSRQLGRLIRSKGQLAICLMGSICAWETCHYLKRGEIRKACRRLAPGGTLSSIGVRVEYPLIRKLRRALRNEFTLRSWAGIGLFVPPSYIRHFSEAALERFAQLDRRVAHWPLIRGLSDHRLLLFTRL